MSNESDQNIIPSHKFQCESLAQVQYIRISRDDEGQRLDNFLIRHLKKVPKSRIYNLLRRGEVRINKSRKKAEYKLQTNDILRLPPVRVESKPKSCTDEAANEAFAARLKEWVIYEDNKLLVINKPPSLAVHGGSGIHLGLIELIRRHFQHAKNWELVHRLDRETSGLIMIAKRRSELRRLHQAFRDNTVHKEYWAILVGDLKQDKHRVTAPLKKNQLAGGARIVRVDPTGQDAETLFEVQGRTPGYTWVLAKPVTGRTHQIRVHSQSLGSPILGDDKYTDQSENAKAKKAGYSGLMLHARRLTIPMDDKPNLILTAAPPTNMAKWLENKHNVDPQTF